MAKVSEIVEYCRKNGSTEYCKQAYGHIKSGAFDAKAEEEGVDLSFAGRADFSQKKTQGMMEEDEGFVGTLGGAFKELGSGLKESFTQRKEAQKATQQEDLNPVRSAIRQVGQGAGFIGDVGFELLKLATPKGVEDIASAGMEAVGQTQPVQGAMQKYQEFKEQHPEGAKDLEAIANFVSLLPVPKAASVAGKGLVKGASATMDAAGDVSKVASQQLDTMIDARRVANVAKNKQAVEEAVGKIIQGTPRDIERAKRALSSVDVSDVKTYRDLNAVIEDKTTALKQTMDGYLDAQDAKAPPLKPDQVAKVTEVGGQKVSQNFVSDALDQLDEMYGAIKDTPSQVRIKQLRDKFNSQGLTRRELNELAREHGTEFGNKAFSKKGDPLTSVNAQAFENTRKGVKEAVRGTIEGDIPKQIDSQITDLLATQRLTKQMEVKVNALWQRVSKRGLPERIARGAADVVDVITLKTVSGFMARMLPSNVGLKTMNSIDLEKQLTKNLKTIERASQATTDEDMVSIIMKEMRESVDNPSVGLAIKDVSKKQIQEIAQRMDGDDFMKLEAYLKALDNQSVTIDMEMRMNDLLEEMGVKPMKRSDEQVRNFIVDVLFEKEEGMKKVPVQSFKSGAVRETADDPLIQEARKYKSAEEFVKAHQASNLMDLSNPKKHRLGRLFEDGVDEDTGRYMDTKYVADMYGKRGNNELYYSRDANVPDVSSPNDIVTIYRGTVKAQEEMLPGDFVSFSKEYAISHNKGEKLISKKVPAKDVVFQGNDFNEWIYSPETIRGRKYNGGLKKIWLDATGGNPMELDPYFDFSKRYNSAEKFADAMKASGKTRSQLTDIWNKANTTNE